MIFKNYISSHRLIAAMIHVPALPGTPGNRLSPAQIIDSAVETAELYRSLGVRVVMIENMHDLPYMRSVGPEIPAMMAVIGREIRRLGMYCGVQVLAGCNREALAVAHAGGLDFVRVEGFVFAHVADEGFMDACAGEILRYRRWMGAEDVMIFADIKKKHSSHAITKDIDLVETARAAAFFNADGVVVTGSATGEPADPGDLRRLSPVPILKAVGSGLTPDNMEDFFDHARMFIIGSYFKEAGIWSNPVDPERVETMMSRFQALGGHG